MRAQDRGWAALALLTAALCAPACSLGAQVVPVGGPPPRVTRVWRVGIDAEAGYESNVRLQPDSGSDRVGRINGLALRTWTQPRGHLTLRGVGSLIRYRESRDLDQFTYGAAGDVSRKISPRAEVTADAGYQTRLSSEIGAAAGPGVTVLPLSLSRTATADAGLAYLLTQNLTGTLTAAYSRVTFDTPLLIPGTTISGAGSLGRRIGQRSSLSVVGRAEHGETQGISLETQSLGGMWATASLSGRYGAAVEAGVTRSVERELTTYRPLGAATARSQFKGGVASLRYSQSVTQAFGLGRLLASRAVTAGYTRVAFYGVSANATAGHTWNGGSAEPGGETTSYQSTDGELDLRRVLTSGLTLGGGVLYRSLDQGSGVTDGAGAVSGTSVRLSVGYTFGGN